MKKLLSLLLALVMVLGISACGKTEPATNDEQNSQITENVTPDVSEETEDKPAEELPEEKEEAPNKKPAEQKPAEKPAEQKPAEKPAETPKTVGTKLLAEFKSKAGSNSAYDIANSIANGGSLPFMAGAMEVEPGLLSGFDNYEVKGFKSGATFGPMIGSIAFIGYVFELEDGVSASDFIANLRNNANLRWNICVEAEEMVTGQSGNKVFFVMCPKAFEE